MADDFYRGICAKCKRPIDSTYCKKVSKGYECAHCKTLHPVNHGTIFHIHMSHIDNKKKDVDGRITLKTGIEKFIEAAGNYGWIVEYSEIGFEDNSDIIKVNPGMKINSVEIPGS